MNWPWTFNEVAKHMHMHFQNLDGSITTFNDILNPPSTIPHNMTVMTGDKNSKPWDLDAPYRVYWLFYDDLPIADNFSDLVVRISSTTPPDKPNDHGHSTIVFFCEGSLHKWVCYDNRLIHHYEPDVPAQKYGIFVDWDLSKKGTCPFLKT